MGCEAIGALRTPPVDTQSPLAASAQAASKKQGGQIPNVRDIPATPTNIMTPAQVTQAIAELNAAGRTLELDPRSTPTLHLDTEKFAIEARERAQGN